MGFGMFSGQSNCVGGGNGLDFLSVRYSRLFADFAPARLISRLGDSGAGPIGWTDYDGAMRPRSTPSRAYGPEVSLGHALEGHFGSGNAPLGKYACNGTSLQGNWRKQDPVIVGEPANLYTQLIGYIAAWEALVGQPCEFFVWTQGNGDANVEAKANAYAANLTQFIADIRADTGRPDMKLVFDQLPAGVAAPFTANVRAQQAIAAAQIDNCIMVPTEGLTLRDTDHYDSRSMVFLGWRFYAALRTWL